MTALSIVVPAYNEEKRIAQLLHELKQIQAEVILVDDGSTDKTVALAKQIIPDILVIANQENQGKGAALKRGVLAAQGEQILIMDADNSTPISELEKLQIYLTDYSVVIGSRALDRSLVKIKQPFYKEFLGRLGNLIIRIILVKEIKDTQCGFKLCSRETKKIWEQLQTKRWAYDFELLYLAQKNGLKIKEVPVLWRNDTASKVKFKDYFLTLIDIFKIKFINKYK